MNQSARPLPNFQVEAELLKRFVAVLAVLIGLSAFAAAPAYAGTASLDTPIYLTAYPPAGANAQISKNIYLAAGNYQWTTYVSGPDNPGQIEAIKQVRIYLAAGTYFWSARIYSTSGNVYRDASSLKTGNLPMATITTDPFIIPRSGNYFMYNTLNGPS